MQEVVDVSSNMVEGGYFVLRNLRSQPFIWNDSAIAGEQFLGTYRDSGSPIRDALISMIRNAKQKVFVASFMIGDEQLIDELIAAATRLRGGVYVITALDEKSLGRGLREYDPDDREPPEERSKNFKRLTSAGVYVRGHSSCHAKFAVVDNQSALVGSANFVSKGFTFTGEANALLRSSLQVSQLDRLFSYLWFFGCEWEVPPGSQYQVAQRSAESSPVLPQSPRLIPGDIVWTDGSESSFLVQAIRKVIDQSRESLTLSTYSIVGMLEKRELILDSLYRAIERGVQCRLFIRQRNAWPSQMKELVDLHDRGVAIHADLRNHAKVAIADRETAMLFSANFDANHGLDSGVEAGVFLSEQKSIFELNRYMDHAIENSDTEFLRDPLARLLDGRLAARWCQKWPGGDAIRVSCTDQDWRRLVDSNSGPVLYELQDATAEFAIGQTVVSGCLSVDMTKLDNVTIQCSDQTAKEKLAVQFESVRRSDANASATHGIFAGHFVRRVCE